MCSYFSLFYMNPHLQMWIRTGRLGLYPYSRNWLKQQKLPNKKKKETALKYILKHYYWWLPFNGTRTLIHKHPGRKKGVHLPPPFFLHHPSANYLYQYYQYTSMYDFSHFSFSIFFISTSPPDLYVIYSFWGKLYWLLPVLYMRLYRK